MRLFCLVVLLFVLPLAAIGDRRNVVCLGHGNITSITSNYSANINSIAAMLRSETSFSPGLYTDHAAGEFPDGVYAVSRCGNGTDSSSCGACITLALQESRTACPYHKSSSFSNGNCSLRLLSDVHIVPASHVIRDMIYTPEETRNIVMRNVSFAMVFQAIGFAWLFFLLLQDSRSRKRYSEMER